MSLRISISPWRVALFLAALWTAIAATDLVLQNKEWRTTGCLDYNEFGGNCTPPDPHPLGRTYELMRLRFDVDQEGNIPAWYDGSVLLLSAVLAFVIASARKTPAWQERFGWRLLSLVFLFLSVDEVSQLHELLGRGGIGLGTKLKGMLGIGFVYFDWVIPAVIALPILGFVLLPFLLRQPRLIVALFIFAGSVFVAGAIGVETYGGRYVESHGSNSMTYRHLATVEETLESLGAVAFIFSLLLYIRRYLSQPDQLTHVGGQAIRELGTPDRLEEYQVPATPAT